jgi:chemotaxis protein CheZ
MLNEAIVEQAKALVAAYDAGDEALAKIHYEQLAAISEQNLFKEIGKLTRELHDTLNNFHLDTRLTSLAAHDIPDAKDRLEYVVQMTADAANKTMDAVEEGLEISSVIQTEANRLNDGWQKVYNKNLEGKDFRSLCDDTHLYMQDAANKSVELNKLLHEALLAQDFQDLTGQVIQRVIQLVQDVESSLIDTIKTFGGTQDYEQALKAERKTEEGATGPTVKAAEKSDVVSGQDDVDDLLSSLGF